MIKKLRLRFIRVAMLAVVLVLLIIMGTINIINYRSVAKDADAILDVLVENGGSFAGMKPGAGGPMGPSENGFGGERPGSDGDFFFDREDRRGIFSAETPFESRFFVVFLDETNEALFTDMTSIAAVSEEDAASLASEALASGKSEGYSGSYRYRVVSPDSLSSPTVPSTLSDAATAVVFLDCQRSLANARSFLLISALVSAIGAAAVLLLVILLSKRVIRPVSESYEKQKQFITNAGHELKTPLTIIDADVSVLEMDLGENEWLDDVKAQTKRLANLTNDLVFLSRMEEGEKHLQMIEFPISDVIAEEAQSFRTRAQVENKTFTTDIAPSLSYTGDEKSIRQLVSILLDNALKYSPEGGEISIALCEKGKNIELSVRNTAEHIDTQNLDRLFERFYRADASRNSESGGHGIGLSIAQAVVAAHKGKIAASSEDGNSLCITATL